MQSYEIVVYVITCVFVIPFAIIVNKKLYSNIKNEEHLEKGKVIQYLVKTYALVQCVGWPFIILTYGSIRLISHFSFGLQLKTLVHSFRFLYTIFRDYVQFHSLIIAISRYTFIVHDSSATRFGINRLRKIFITSSVVVPLLSSVFYEFTCPIEKSYLYWSYGQQWAETSQNNTKNQSYEQSGDELESIFFVLFRTIFSPSVVNAISMVENVLFSIIYSNLIEGCIYCHLFIWLHR